MGSRSISAAGGDTVDVLIDGATFLPKVAEELARAESTSTSLGGTSHRSSS